MINIFQTDEMEVKNPLFNDDPTPKLQWIQINQNKKYKYTSLNVNQKRIYSMWKYFLKNHIMF